MREFVSANSRHPGDACVKVGSGRKFASRSKRAKFRKNARVMRSIVLCHYLPAVGPRFGGQIWFCYVGIFAHRTTKKPLNYGGIWPPRSWYCYKGIYSPTTAREVNSLQQHDSVWAPLWPTDRALLGKNAENRARCAYFPLQQHQVLAPKRGPAAGK